MNKQHFEYKWRKIFASKRYGNKPVILSALEQQELLDDAHSIEVQTESLSRGEDDYESLIHRHWEKDDSGNNDDDGHGGTIKHFRD